MKRENTIWTERYRPDTLEGYVGNETLRAKLTQYIEEQDIPHLLFYGTAGTGKTTAAKIIRNNIDADCLFINASDERGIDTIRDKLKGFASSMGFKKYKIIVLDECLEEDTMVYVLRAGEEQKIFIKDLDPNNDLVKSWNVKNNRVEWRPFEKIDTGEQEVYEVEFENGEVVVCTGTHKWYVMHGDAPVVVRTTDLHKYNHILSPQ